MKSFTMNQNTMNQSTLPHELATDESGRLYSVHMRELLEPLKVDITAVEALAALKIAGRFLHLLQERWAEAHGLTEGRMGVLFPSIDVAIRRWVIWRRTSSPHLETSP